MSTAPGRRRPSAEHAEVVIVGGGVIGAATAYALSRAGVNDVVLLERGELASGSSGKPLGGLRAVFSDAVNVELGHRSLDFYRRFTRDLGVDIGLQQVGYLFALRHQQDVEAHATGVAVQNRLGVPSRLIDPHEAADLCPYLDTSNVLAAVWSPDAGFARPTDAVRGLSSAAAAAGVQVRTGSQVVAIESKGDDLARLRLSDGQEILTPTLMCTAGAWSPQIAAMVGVNLPIVARRRQIAFTPPLPGRPRRLPFTIDHASTAYFHGSDDGGLLLGWADPDQADGFGCDVDRDWHAGLRKALREVAPQLTDVPLERGWAGLYELTPDCNALIGEARGTGFRFLYAAGFSGHGFLQAPAVGECLRDLHLGRFPVVDVSGLNADRFLRPVQRTELGIV